MYKSVVFSLLFLSLFSCADKSDKNFVLKGNVEGLKKGTLYIQRIDDSILKPIDTIKISGDAHFTSEFDLKSPEVHRRLDLIQRSY